MPNEKIESINSRDVRDRLLPVSLTIITGILLTGALFVMRPVLVPFVFSVFLFFVISPFVDWQQVKLKMPRSLAMGTTFIVLILIFAVFVILLGASIKGFVKSSGEYQLKLLNLLDEFAVYSRAQGYQLDLSIIRQSLIQLPVVTWVTQVSSSVVTIVGNIVLIFIFTLFLLMGKKSDEGNRFIDEEMQWSITRYLSTKFFTSLATGIIVFVILAAFQVQLALMFAVLTFFLNFIPNVGSIIAILLPLPVVLLQYGAGWTLVFVTVLTSVVQFVIGSIIDPKIMGENLGLHPAVILLSLLFWGFIWGVPGMFLSVPMTAVVKLMFSRSKRFKTLAGLLEGGFR
jgi:AI-2 transport protein TqsA